MVQGQFVTERLFRLRHPSAARRREEGGQFVLIPPPSSFIPDLFFLPHPFRLSVPPARAKLPRDLLLVFRLPLIAAKFSAHFPASTHFEACRFLADRRDLKFDA